MFADLPVAESMAEGYKLTHSEKKAQKYELMRERRRLNRKVEKQNRKYRRSAAEGAADKADEGQQGSTLKKKKKKKDDPDSWTAHRPRLVVDMSFDSHLEDKEVRSVANQVQMSYGWMRSKCERPLELHLTSLTPRMEQALQRHVGYSRWPVGKHEQCHTEVFADEVDKLVYLSPDATDVLMEIDPDKIYIIGGIADTHIQKGLTLRKARDQGIATACLPLKEFEASHRTVLNVNHVVEIVTTVAETGDWRAALARSIPKRRAYHHTGRADEDNFELPNGQDGVPRALAQ